MKHIQLLALLLGAFLLNHSVVMAKGKHKVRLLSWNMEHLAEHNHTGCRARDDKDYRALKHYAKTLGGDVVALQEVASKKAVARVFPERDWHIEVSERPSSEPYECRRSGRLSTQQKVAIVIRKGIKYQRLTDLKALGLEIEGLRFGVQIRLLDFEQPIDIMAVHLKTGCFVDDYSRTRRKVCSIFKKQVKIIDNWTEKHLAASRPFVLLGDFNHRLNAPYNRFWRDLVDFKGQHIDLVNSMDDKVGCHPKYPAPIDHILLSPLLREAIVTNSARADYFGLSAKKMKPEDMLTDHCPISIDVNLKGERQ